MTEPLRFTALCCSEPHKWFIMIHWVTVHLQSLYLCNCGIMYRIYIINQMSSAENLWIAVVFWRNEILYDADLRSVSVGLHKPSSHLWVHKLTLPYGCWVMFNVQMVKYDYYSHPSTLYIQTHWCLYQTAVIVSADSPDLYTFTEAKLTENMFWYKNN